MDDILIATDRADAWGAGFEYAAALAARLRASLTATYMLPPLAPSAERAPASVACEILERARVQIEQAMCAGNAFKIWAASRGVPASTWHACHGDIAEVLTVASHWHDAIVLERSQLTSWGLAQRLLLAADIPVIVLPADGEAPRFEHIAIAWNGSLQATRALHAALPLLRRASDVTLLDGTTTEYIETAGILDPYLREHGLEVTRIRIDAEPADAGEQILAAAECAADLLIMGAWGRTRLSEWMFGGATRHVLQHAAIPVLLRH